jgi:hypothetical protein
MEAAFKLGLQALLFLRSEVSVDCSLAGIAGYAGSSFAVNVRRRSLPIAITGLEMLPQQRGTVLRRLVDIAS